MINIIKHFAKTLVLILVVSCVSKTTPYENFKNHMQFHVGKKYDSPETYIARYPDKNKGKETLVNGNTEIEFVLNDKCQVWFEVDKNKETIVAWRYEGHKEACQIVP